MFTIATHVEIINSALISQKKSKHNSHPEDNFSDKLLALYANNPTISVNHLLTQIDGPIWLDNMNNL